MDKKKYLKYNPERDEIEEIKEDIDFTIEDIINEINNDMIKKPEVEEDLIDYQVQKVLKSEKENINESYIEDNYGSIIEEAYQQKRAEKEDKKEFLTKEDALDIDYKFNAENEKGLSKFKEFIIKRKLKKKRPKKEKKTEKVKEIDNKTENEEKKPKMSSKSFFFKLILIVICLLLIKSTIDFLFPQEIDKPNIEDNTEKKVIVKEEKPEKEVPITKIPADDKVALSFVKYLNRCEKIINAMTTISNEEYEVVSKYINWTFHMKKLLFISNNH